MAKKAELKKEVLENKEVVKIEVKPFRRKSNRAPLLTKKEKKDLGVGRDEGRASVRNIRVPSKKAKQLLDVIRGKNLDEAYAILKHVPRSASEYVLKLMESAEANAVNNFELDKEKLYVADAFANQGPTLKRIKAKARGSATRIKKRTSHITIVLKERA
ncbi:MAG: 50S ribosomal protein L22 [Clostridia bacterium]